MSSMEPDAINTLVKETESLVRDLRSEFKDGVPDRIKSIFSDTSKYLEVVITDEWRQHKRYDELIEYISYLYGEHGGERLWTQVLLDLRLNGDEKRALRLLGNLCPGREEKFWIAVEKANEFPDNYICKVEVAKKKGDVMKVLYEYAYILENKPSHERNEEEIEEIKERILEIINETKSS